MDELDSLSTSMLKNALRAEEGASRATPNQESSGGSPLTAPGASSGATAPAEPEAEIVDDDPLIGTPELEERPFAKRLSVWQARPAGQCEPAGVTASTDPVVLMFADLANIRQIGEHGPHLPICCFVR